MAVTLTWPAVLPLPRRRGYKIKPGDPIRRTVMASGNARQRRLFTKVPSTIDVEWVFSAWEYAVFEGWIEHKAKKGAVWFNIDLLSGLGIQAHQARLIQREPPYEASNRSADSWEVTATLEIRRRPVLTEAAMEIAVNEDIAGLIRSIDGINGLIHARMPGPHAW
jgi:hypothetical protein